MDTRNLYINEDRTVVSYSLGGYDTVHGGAVGIQITYHRSDDRLHVHPTLVIRPEGSGQTVFVQLDDFQALAVANRLQHAVNLITDTTVPDEVQELLRASD